LLYTISIFGVSRQASISIRLRACCNRGNLCKVTTTATTAALNFETDLAVGVILPRKFYLPHMKRSCREITGCGCREDAEIVLALAVFE